MGSDNGKGDCDGWARLRFAVVGPLLASPPPKGRLRAELERLAQQSWEHPTGGGQVHFSASDDRALVLPGAVGAPGSGQGLAPAGADRCRPRAEDVAAARRGLLTAMAALRCVDGGGSSSAPTRTSSSGSRLLSCAWQERVRGI